MIKLDKSIDRDLIVLNLTDTQLGNSEWEQGHQKRAILEYTVRELVERVKPDLITITGDLAWAGHTVAYESLADFMDSFGIPWSCVWGNHDNQDGADFISGVVASYSTRKNFIYEEGDPKFGNGNFIISVEENGRPITAIFMIDSHDREEIELENGEKKLAWAKLLPEQLEWIESTSLELKASGYHDGMILLHIPFYVYRKASEAAYRSGIDLRRVSVSDSMGSSVWNEGYENSIGVQHEGIGSHPVCDGAFRSVKRADFVKTIIAGHEHVNSFIINFADVRLVYSLKTGAGCYWEPELNGGTVVKIGKNGVRDIYHEYVDLSHLL